MTPFGNLNPNPAPSGRFRSRPWRIVIRTIAGLYALLLAGAWATDMLNWHGLSRSEIAAHLTFTLILFLMITASARIAFGVERLLPGAVKWGVRAARYGFYFGGSALAIFLVIKFIKWAWEF